ncbi:CNT family concentrative nucleoside transporter [Salsuginibacillus halophilus]|uniref:Nucleoside permease n=1 Tax=Salsuginibacillus halophilus TaxID=517424 RepID=A0A2P8HWK1_9BACI|nr:NupC/NupG family nucleoside CNT transporter [Salsuginibacillus halophilus]PSL50616.1 CNT family concentrative nucleoside transporter [Salsuginibacillus halophilus]
MNILWGILGIATVFLLAFLASERKKHIKLRPLIGGLAFQLLFAFIVLGTTVGENALAGLTFAVAEIIDYTNEGILFLFDDVFDNIEEDNIFALQVLPVIIFFSSLISILYYLGIMQFIVKVIGGFLSWVLNTSKAESMSAAANIFVGQTEAPLVVRPYLDKMTRSEFFTVLTGGLASVAGSVLIGYSLLGVRLDYLLAASFMAAPAGLIMAKTIMPETEVSETSDEIKLHKDTESQNVIDAAARGAATGLQLALNVGAMLLAFIALIALVNGGLELLSNIPGVGVITLEQILGIIFAPIAFLVGVPWSEALMAGNFIGQKLVLNEFVAYANFAPEVDAGNISEKAEIVITFALCGFANISSLAILIGGIGSLVPDRRREIAQLGVRAVIAGALASLLSASIAGMFIL